MANAMATFHLMFRILVAPSEFAPVDAQERLASVFSQPTPTAVIDAGSYEGQEQTQQISADVGPEGAQVTPLPPVADSSEAPYEIGVPSFPDTVTADVVDVPLPLPAPSIGTSQQPASSSVSEKLDQVKRTRKCERILDEVGVNQVAVG